MGQGCIGVRRWLEGLSDVEFGRTTFYIDLLQDQGPLLGEPYSRQLDGKLRRLRLDRRAMRVTYWIAPGRRLILLTVFEKSRRREFAQVRRARKALRSCIQENHILQDD